MKLLNKRRAGGKTMGLIFTSEATGYPIVVETHKRARKIQDFAEQLGTNIPKPMSVEEYLNFSRGKRIEKILIDEGLGVIQMALEKFFQTKVATVTMTLDDKQ